MSDSSTKSQPNTRVLRCVVIVLVFLFLAVLGAVLLRPMELSEVLRWNILVGGYTVVGLLVAGISFVMALALGLIALSATRVKLIKRLKNFLVVTVASSICLIVLDLLLPTIMPSACLDDPVMAHILAFEGTPFVLDEELGMRYRAGYEVTYVVNMLYGSDMIMCREIDQPVNLYEPETGQSIVIKVDRNGFFNDIVVDKCDIFVVGDSYAVPPLPHQYYWANLLKEKTGKTVYNAGTVAYSFQQELLVLQRYGHTKKPKTVIWGYFQGNDLSEAENFDAFQKSGLSWRDYWLNLHGFDDRPFPYNRPLVRFLVAQANRLGYLNAMRAELGYQVPCEIVVADKRKTYACTRQYMLGASRTREGILESRGWEICCESLKAAKAKCDKIAARFVIVYFPSKITVLFDQMEDKYDWDVYYRYLSLVDKRVRTDNAQQARERLRVNRTVQCELLKEFCAQNDIELVDTTKPLQDAAQQGLWPYFSYDTHLNIEGNRVVAETLAQYFANNNAP